MSQKRRGGKIKSPEYWNGLLVKIDPRYSFVSKSGVEFTVRCSTHGEFTYRGQIRKIECPACRMDRWARERLEKFHTEVAGLYGNEYDYSGVTSDTIGHWNHKVPIVCSAHGEFWETPQRHIQHGKGCPDCRGTRYTKQSFVDRSVEKYGDLFSYEEVDVTRSTDVVTLTCKKHKHRFEVVAGTHIRSKSGGGCKWCRGEGRRTSPEDALSHITQVHGGRYEYAYLPDSAQDDARIICPVHGVFEQRLYSHNAGHGCPSCVKPPSAVSSQEKVITSWFPGKNVQTGLRGLIGRQELDIVFPEYNLAIEVDSGYWHSTEYRTDPDYHQNKLNHAREKGIRLLQVWDFEVDTSPDILKSMILNAMGELTTSVPARKCSVVTLTSAEYAQFFRSNHLQGAITSRIKLGLVHGGEIVAALGMTQRRGVWYIDRFANKLQTRVVGGFSRLLKHSGVRGRIVTHSANRYSDGELYRKSGFSLISEAPRTLFYTYAGKVYDRNRYQKHKLTGWDNYSPEKTANQILREKHIYPVYHSGTRTWEIHL